VTFVESWPRARACLVGIAALFSKEQRGFPQIIGTGFLVSPQGLVCTCRHVVDSFAQLAKPAEYTGIPASAVFFMPDEATGNWGFASIEILSYGHGTVTGDTSAYAGPRPLDVSYLMLNVTDTPYLRVAESPMVEGEPVAVGGFPMGTDLMQAPGWLHQITPTLLQGTISAVLPHHRHPTPHGILIQAPTLGGSSGSPVFREDASVVGMVYAGVNKPTPVLAVDGKHPPQFVLPSTGLTLCVSRDIIAGTLRGAEADATASKGRPTWADRLKSIKPTERHLGDGVFDVWPGSKQE